MRTVKKINTKGIKESDIKDSDIPLLNVINKQREIQRENTSSESALLKHIEKQQIIKDNKLISDQEKEQNIQDDQIRIDNDIKGCYVTFNIMFYGLIILMLIPVTFLFRGFTIQELFNFYGIYVVFGRNIVLIPLGIMFWMWQTSKKKDILHPSTIKMRKMFKIIFIITMLLVVISLFVFGSGLKDLNI